MNESLLKALLQLFALVTDSSDSDAIKLARLQVASFLKNKIPVGRIDEFLDRFDEFVVRFGRSRKPADAVAGHKKSSLNSVKVILLCEEINQNLSRQDKFVVMLRLLEFVHVGGRISFRESGFLETLSQVFNLDAAVFELMQHFVENDESSHPNLLHLTEELLPENKRRPGFRFNGKVTALILPHSDTIFLKQIGSSNMLINRLKMQPTVIYPISWGDVLENEGAKAITYNELARLYNQRFFKELIQFSASEVSYQFNRHQTAIHPFSLHEQSGALAGIMGASGSGKSTLLNLLNGNLKPAAGHIKLNGLDIYTNPEVKQLIGYVPQDDLLLEELTVFENLWFSAKLCLPNLKKEDTRNRIIELLHQLDLDEISNLRVGSSLNKLISGGQRKRLNIALELLREPEVLFVDEPTSGLSSHDSEMVMQLLRDITLKGKLVFAVIHQPSLHIFKLLDSLILMDKGGYPVYYGNPLEAPHYFRQQVGLIESEDEHELDPDEMLRIIEARKVNEKGQTTQLRMVEAAAWYEKFQTNFEIYEKVEEGPQSANHKQITHASALKQFSIYFKRNVLTKFRNRSYLLVALLEVPVLALIIGFFTRFAAGTDDNPAEYIFFYNKNLPAYLFMTVVVAIFVGMQLAAEEIIRDRKILLRESFLNLSWASYINSKLAYLVLLSALQTALLVLIGNSILEIKGMTLIFSAVLFPVFVFSNLLGLNLSAAFQSAVTVYILVPFLVVPQLLLSGVIVDFDTLLKPEEQSKKVPLIGELMASRWAYEAMAVAQFKRNDYQRHFFKDEQVKNNAWYQFSMYLPKLINLNDRASELIEDPNNQAVFKDALITLRNEVSLLNQNSPRPFENVKSLVAGEFNKQLSLQLSAWLRETERQQRKIWEISDLRIEELRRQLALKLGVPADLQELRLTYHNQKLDDQLRNRNDINRIRQVNGQLIRKADYIFMPPQNNFGRAHFYAPHKQIGAVKIDTLWFNLGVLWAMNLLLYLLLLLKIPGRITQKRS
jgi:ABC transport system ATP-binding/permease protein